MQLPSLNAHALLVMWAQLLVIVAVARGLGSLMRRYGQPPVVGELLAGVVLGPSVFAKIWPQGAAWLFPPHLAIEGPLNAIGWLGIALLLLLTGFETDLGLVRQAGRAAVTVSLAGLLIPFAGGIGVGLALPASFLGSHPNRAVFVLFIAITLAITSLPVIAKILSELGFLRRNFGQLTLAVGVVNDVVGWIALGILSGLATSGSLRPGSMALVLGGITIALVVSFTLASRGIERLLRAVRHRNESTAAVVSANIVVMLVFAVVFEAIHSDAVLGAFVAGIVLSRSRSQSPSVRTNLEPITYWFLAPIFFATAGLRLNLPALANPQNLAWSAVILAVAVATKLAGAFVGGRFGGLSQRESLALGVGLNARGAVEVVIATVGLSLGVLGSTSYTAIVLMAIVTSVMAPPLLRLVVRNWQGGPEEKARLEREESLSANLLVRPGRILLPSRGQPNSLAAAHLVHLAWPPETDVTVLSVDHKTKRPDVSAMTKILGRRSVDFRRAADENALAAILKEARLGYGAIAVGASDQTQPGRLLSPVVDDLLLKSPVPVVVVRQAKGRNNPSILPVDKVLVPTAGTPASRIAQEIALNLSREVGSEVLLAHVVTRTDPPPGSEAVGRVARHAPENRESHSSNAAMRVTQQAEAMGAEVGARTRSVIRSGISTAEEILLVATETEANLIVIGATVRRLEGRPFLGHTVERILEEAKATVVVVTVPEPGPSTGATGDSA